MPKRRVIPVFVPHLGCPNDCVFCNQRKISGATTPATEETVINALNNAKDNILHGEKGELAFYGGSFTAIPASDQEKLLKAAFPFFEMGVIDSIRLSTRPDCIDDETLIRLKKYGVKTIELGVQSMCEDVLIKSNRGHTKEDAVRSARLIKKEGFSLILQMMTGLPGDTLENSLYTAREIAKLEPDGVRIYPTVVIKDTKLWEMWLAGKYNEHTVDEAVNYCSEILEIFRDKNIPVIRLGLNPTEELSGGSAAAGAYHPAFGELVYGEMYYKKERELLKDHIGAKKVVFGVKKGKISTATGQKKRNITRLYEEFKIGQIKFCETEVIDGDITILEVEKD